MHWYQNLNNNDKLTISHINNSILEKAVIIDFEGPKEGKPELVGYFKDNKFKTIFLNNAFESCKSRYSAGCMTLDEFTDLILKDINEEDRLVIAFSVHEANILLDYFLKEFSKLAALCCTIHISGNGIAGIQGNPVRNDLKILIVLVFSGCPLPGDGSVESDVEALHMGTF